MSKKGKQDSIPFSRVLQLIERELKEENPKYTAIVEEALKKDGTLAIKVKFGALVDIKFLPENTEDSPE